MISSMAKVSSITNIPRLLVDSSIVVISTKLSNIGPNTKVIVLIVRLILIGYEARKRYFTFSKWLIFLGLVSE